MTRSRGPPTCYLSLPLVGRSIAVRFCQANEDCERRLSNHCALKSRAWKRQANASTRPVHGAARRESIELSLFSTSSSLALRHLSKLSTQDDRYRYISAASTRASTGALARHSRVATGAGWQGQSSQRSLSRSVAQTATLISGRQASTLHVRSRKSLDVHPSKAANESRLRDRSARNGKMATKGSGNGPRGVLFLIFTHTHAFTVLSFSECRSCDQTRKILFVDASPKHCQAHGERRIFQPRVRRVFTSKSSATTFQWTHSGSRIASFRNTRAVDWSCTLSRTRRLSFGDCSAAAAQVAKCTIAARA